MNTVGFVVAEYYEDLVDDIVERARQKLADREATVETTVTVPGVFDAPLAADRLARRDAIDAVTVLGAVVTGDTDHDQVVARTAADHVAQVSRGRDTPVTWGVLGPNLRGPEAEARLDEAAAAAVASVDLVESLPPRDGEN